MSLVQIQNSKSLNRITDNVLLANTEKLASAEREILTDILHHLKEIDRRKLFSALKYPSLFEYAKDRLKYSEDQAYRRITAMKLLKEIPELESKITSGAISLSHMNMAQGLFRRERTATKNGFSKVQKLDVMKKLENQPARQAQKIILKLSSSPVPPSYDRIRPISETGIEVKFYTDELLEEKIKRLKGLLAHKHPEMTLSELFHKLCDVGLKEWDPQLWERKSGRRFCNASVTIS